MICIYLSRGKGGEVVVSAFHDQRSAIWIYFIGGKGVWVGISFIISFFIYPSGEMGVWLRVSVIHDLQSAICIYLSGIEVSVIQDLEFVICIYFSGCREYR